MPADVECAKCTFNHSHKKRKDEPNWPFYALLLRTKLY